jgi:hypothetical protein
MGGVIALLLFVEGEDDIEKGEEEEENNISKDTHTSFKQKTLKFLTFIYETILCYNSVKKDY